MVTLQDGAKLGDISLGNLDQIDQVFEGKAQRWHPLQAGQSTRQVSLPACDTGAVARCPHVQEYDTVLAAASKPVTRVPAMCPQAAQRALYGDQSSFSALPLSSWMMRLMVSVCCSAAIICVSNCPERYTSWASSTSSLTPSVCIASRNGAEKCSA